MTNGTTVLAPTRLQCDHEDLPTAYPPGGADAGDGHPVLVRAVSGRS